MDQRGRGRENVPSTNTSVATTETELLTDLGETGDGTLTRSARGLVDLGKHSVGGLRDNGGGETGNQTRAKVDGGLGAVGESVLVEVAVDSLRDLLEDDELGHGVGDPGVVRFDIMPWVIPGNLLLEEHGAETRVEGANTLLAQDLGETRGETGSEGGLRDETDTGSLKRAESNVGEEFGGSGGSEVDGGSVLRGVLDANLVDALLLEEFVATELEGTLEEVTGGGGTETSEKSASTLVGDDLTETTDHTLVVGDGVKLDTGLDADFISIYPLYLLYLCMGGRTHRPE